MPLSGNMAGETGLIFHLARKNFICLVTMELRIGMAGQTISMVRSVNLGFGIIVAGSTSFDWWFR